MRTECCIAIQKLNRLSQYIAEKDKIMAELSVLALSMQTACAASATATGEDLADIARSTARANTQHSLLTEEFNRLNDEFRTWLNSR